MKKSLQPKELPRGLTASEFNVTKCVSEMATTQVNASGFMGDLKYKRSKYQAIRGIYFSIYMILVRHRAPLWK